MYARITCEDTNAYRVEVVDAGVSYSLLFRTLGEAREWADHAVMHWDSNASFGFRRESRLDQAFDEAKEERGAK